MDQQPTGKKREIIAALAVLIVIVAIVAGASVMAKKDSDEATADNTKTSQSTSDTASDSKSKADTATTDTTNANTTTGSTYKDGTYTATGSYTSPGGSQKITIHVTLVNDVVTATSADSGASDIESKEYQTEFMSGYKQLVIGKKIENISLSRVSGSSLTSQGFNSAIQQIESQAKNA